MTREELEREHPQIYKLAEEYKEKWPTLSFKEEAYLTTAFVWVYTPEGNNFWGRVNNGEFDVFYATYPRKETESEIQRLLGEAKRRYPIGTVYKWMNSEGEGYEDDDDSSYKPITAAYTPNWIEHQQAIDVGVGYVYSGKSGKWAEIVNEKTNMGTEEKTYQEISRDGLREIYDVVCADWKFEIEQLIREYEPFADKFKILNEHLERGLKEADARQKEVIFKYLKEPSKKVKSWDDLENISGWYIDSRSTPIEVTSIHTGVLNKNLFATKKQAESALAAAQLSQLVKHTNGDWEPNWGDNFTIKYSIVRQKNNLHIANRTTNFVPMLVFKTPEKAKEFLKNHEELIKTYLGL